MPKNDACRQGGRSFQSLTSSGPKYRSPSTTPGGMRNGLRRFLISALVRTRTSPRTSDFEGPGAVTAVAPTGAGTAADGFFAAFAEIAFFAGAFSDDCGLVRVWDRVFSGFWALA